MMICSTNCIRTLVVAIALLPVTMSAEETAGVKPHPRQTGSTFGAAAATPDQIVTAKPQGQPAPAGLYETLSVLTVRAEEFRPRSSSVTYETDYTHGNFVYQTSVATVDWWAPVHLPTGTLIYEIALEACDSTSTGQTVLGFTKFDVPGQGGADLIYPIGTGMAATYGCTFHSTGISSPIAQIDNYNYGYALSLAWQGDFTAANAVSSVQIFYKRQVSPAPVTATFTDVPTTSPWHRYVEALVAAGITGGCGPELFCPDAPVSRAQMAVFLSVALGLHFPW